MIDVTTQRPLYVSYDGESTPYIMLPVAQLEQVERLLKRHGVTYWVDAHAISLDGKPEVTFINLSRNSEFSKVQGLLDESR